MSERIEDRLTATLKYDVIHGDESERTILARQIQEAINELRQLRTKAARLDEVIECLEALLPTLPALRQVIKLAKGGE